MIEVKKDGTSNMGAVRAEQKDSFLYRGFKKFFRTSEDLDLDTPPPVSYEKCTREIRLLQAIQNFNDGVKFEFQSVISPRFSTAHSFSWGSQQQPPTYMFSTIYAGKKFFINGGVDDQGSLQLHGDYNWFQKSKGDDVPDDKVTADSNAYLQSPAVQSQLYNGTVSRLRAQLHKIPAKSIVQLEHDLYGKNFVLSLRSSNHNMFQTAGPIKKVSDLFSLNGAHSISFMQKLTKSLSVGAEYSHQRINSTIRENILSFAMRYAKYPTQPYPQPPAFPPSVPSPFPQVSPKDPERSFVVIFSPSVGVIYSSFYQRLSQRLEAFTDINIPTSNPPENAPPQSHMNSFSLGFKLDTLHSTIRTMIDSNFNVTTHLEERLFPGFAVQISARTNYGKDSTNMGHVGLSFTLES